MLPTNFSALAFQAGRPAAALGNEYQETMLASLRQAAPGVVLAILFIAGGLACVALYLHRRRSSDPASLWFGIFLVLYGIRIHEFLSVLSFLYPGHGQLWDYLAAVITHIIFVPAILFAREIFPTWRPALRWILWILVPLIFVNIAADAWFHSPFHFDKFNGALTLLLFTTFMVAVFVLRQSAIATRGLRVGLLIFAITVVIQNLRGIGFFHLSHNVEPFGFAIFVLTLADLISHRTAESQQRLIAFDREMDIARQIQAAILPGQLPHTGRITVAARYLPMTAVAGDFYDVLEVSPAKLGVLIADVSGHGVPAALIASMVKVAVAAQFPHADDPAQVLAGINHILCGKLTGQFVTAAYLYLDLDVGIMRYSAAGHPAMLWRHQTSPNNETITSVEENGLPLGMMSFATYAYKEHPLTPGSRFVLYTDGIAEASNPQQEFFGAEGIRATMAQWATMDADRYADALLERVQQWVGPRRLNQQEDDLTLLVVDLA